jgi:hypothetical protein
MVEQSVAARVESSRQSATSTTIMPRRAIPIEYLYSTAQIIDFVAVNESEEGMNHEKTTSSRGGATSVRATMNCSGRCCGDVLSWRFERGGLFLILPKAAMWLSTAAVRNHVVTNPRGHIVDVGGILVGLRHFCWRLPCEKSIRRPIPEIEPTASRLEEILREWKPIPEVSFDYGTESNRSLPPRRQHDFPS